MAGHPREKVIPDEVHQNQILRELYLKELRTQKLYTQYHVNPLRKIHTITRKPMSWHDNLEEPADARFLNLIHHTAQGPRKKYPETQTENQEVGWDLEPLGFTLDRQDTSNLSIGTLAKPDSRTITQPLISWSTQNAMTAG
ncbi:PREDICTED: protein FAM183A isoform X1 [Rhinopithecus bieti]|uniref:protein FAM183A isoform X1 n=1 Tax=Rhinopithecus bieti TaxID=61621 RepID=UPI00083BE74D|nr:PREDICTED: protein FAM183A isoform X1 [Rhinopithecus bieti]XP_033082701.1 protein FAM183A isoform X1 [Trachypithecus francoisi]